MAKLTLEHQGRAFKIREYPLTIGSSAANDILVNRAAGEHAVIEETGEGLQLRALHPCHLNGKPVSGSRILDGNARLNIAGAVLPLWLDPEKPMPALAPGKRWAWVAHPAAAAFWFILAIALPLWLGYLAAPQRYLLDYSIIFTMAATIIAIVWLMNAFLLPLVGRHLVVPLLGIVSWLSVFSDLSEQAAYYFNFQFDWGGFDIAALLLTIAVFWPVLRGYLRDSTAIAGAALNRYALGAALPCLILLAFAFLNRHDFFAQRGGTYPSYHRELLPHIIPGKEAQSISAFFDTAP
ncbi:MAG: FHA domain-containing protein [Cardiobacteriaceae bacterium]|nr:FHA domain-containing protein [Cardiobacteriaceae bacterium]